MKLRSALLCALSLGCAMAAEPELTRIRTVYLLPMGGGLDQYLANKLTASRLYQVVTTPADADAIFTDRIGPEFEQRMTELYPPPEPTEDEEKTEKKKPATKDKDEEQSFASMMGTAAGMTGRRVSSSFSRSRGTIFLVDRASNRVLWSTYLRVRGTRPDEMDRLAGGVIDRLDDAAGHEVKRIRKEEKTAAPAK